MQNKYFLDTNIVLRFFLKDSQEQYKRVEALFKKAKLGKVDLIVIPQIIFEINYVLGGVYKLKKTEIIKLIKSFLAWEYVEIREKQSLGEAIWLYQNKNVDLIDCFLFALAKNNKAEVFSFDKDFKKLLSA